jgi:cleavage and polyadenylation specificity factor subunit 3
MFLEAQFGADAVSPIPLPRNSTSTSITDANASGTPTTSPQPTNGTAPSDPYSVASLPRTSDSPSSDNSTPSPADLNLSAEDKAELKRLHGIGIPVPGILIKFDKYEAKVWLEDLDVECSSAALKARVKAVVERGVETVSGLWA